MSTPFICRQCIARLTKVHASQIRPKCFQLHTQALPSPVQQQAWALPTPERPESSIEHDGPSYHLSQPPTSHPGPFVSQIPGFESGRGREPRLRKFLPQRHPAVARSAHIHRPVTLRYLKLKILKSRANFRFIRDDVAYLYGLPDYGARHAVNQLGRLLGGRHSGLEAGQELDRYHEWKINIHELLKAVKAEPPTSNDSDGSTQTNVETDATKQSWEAFAGVWSELSNERRKLKWRDYIASLFRSTPDQAISFMHKTFRPEWCLNYVVEDSVYLILWSLKGAEDRMKRGKQIVDLLFFLLQNAPPKYLVLDQWSIWQAVSLIPVSRLFEFYQILRRLEHPLRQNTLLHFARRLAVKSKYKAQATDILRFLSTMPGFDINAPAPSSVCTTLFTMKEDDVVTNDDAAPDELFKTLLDVGFRPSLFGLSALMRNFCLRGRIDVAWRIFNSLLEAGIEPDAHVFSILLNGAKTNLDRESVQRDINMIEATQGWTQVLLNDLLDYIYQFAESQEEKRRAQRERLNIKAYRLMIQLYSKFFHYAPLKKLVDVPLGFYDWGLDDPIHPHLQEVTRMISNLRQLPDDLLLEPDSITLEIMLRARFRSIKGPDALIIYYRHFMSSLTWGDPVLTALVKDRGTVIYDIFLRDFLQFKETFNSGVALVQRVARYANLEKQKHGKNTLHPPPSVYTYTILMNGYRNHKKYEGVIRTLNEMIEKDITPNIVTWNVVIGSLLDTGSMTRAVRVIEHLNQIDLQPNDRTIEEVTHLSLGKRKEFADLMGQVEKHPRKTDTRTFVKWLIRLWRMEENGPKESKEPNISQKDARLINRFYDNIETENIRWNAGLRDQEDKPKVDEKLEDGGKDMDFIMSVRKNAKENKASRRESRE
ncbi:uncharacterized protein GGS22DRAFT_171832 [Annulohypoxylon maeteangense]|uniref:uncharacterized protein n=1 Tax=Annulohypoxylon maeteangense TaxID=1927788 RepID=UPI00200751F6|nr:uncharacterized protein GGS22DRAFT_171832 [Annulohypoxylon maeteangense]KAI0881770.1 hypothetical protein GGS22DRAFT_171832 [Annulohypoxylon maeteangense]